MSCFTPCFGSGISVRCIYLYDTFFFNPTNAERYMIDVSLDIFLSLIFLSSCAWVFIPLHFISLLLQESWAASYWCSLSIIRVAAIRLLYSIMNVQSTICTLHWHLRGRHPENFFISTLSIIISDVRNNFDKRALNFYINCVCGKQDSLFIESLYLSFCILYM